MKNTALRTCIFTGILAFLLTGCGNDSDVTDDKRISDSAHVADSIASLPFLENLLNIHDEEALKIQFGYENVMIDTIWGYEGYFRMGTILKTEPSSHIEISWMNDALKIGILSVTLVSDSDWYSDTLASSMWKSTTGVSIGMPIEGLQKLNERPFTFSGFGWDYAGSVHDWQKGELDGKGIAVQLSEGPIDTSITITDVERNSVLGDVEVQSDNPVLKFYQPRVWSISVAKVQ